MRTLDQAATSQVSVQQVADEQTQAEGRIPGNRGIWVGIFCVFVEFALLFCVYFVARMNFPEAFAQGPQRLNLAAGTTITLVMISSGFLIAASVVSLRTGRVGLSRWLLLACFLLALGYPITKIFEIQWNHAHDLRGNSGVFITVYYYLTLNHLVHAFWGLLGMIWVLMRHFTGAYTPEETGGLEAMASYWHATDLIWLAIFPLFYVLS